MRHIVLTGFMGAGKTAVGRRLAKRLGRPFLDTDQLIEEQSGRTISEIFAEDGEAGFRRIERETVAALAPDAPSVIATGGGTFVDAANQARLRELGVVICLLINIDTVVERTTRNSKRPLASGGRADLERLFAERLPAYRQADVLVETDNLSIEQSVTRVLSILEPRLKADSAHEREPA